ncbi:MAG: lamin tail domain-containing protein [Saprospiraceae bacterium]
MKKLMSTLFAVCMMANFATAQIVITEIMYNNPGADDLEFIELFNSGNAAVNLDGYHFTQGVNDTIFNVMINPGEFYYVAEDASDFTAAFGATNVESWSGSLSNGGEDIVLRDNAGIAVDSVDYDDNLPWSTIPDGEGSSLELCDVSADNADPNNWEPSTTEVAGLTLVSANVYASINSLSTCVDPIIITFDNNNEDVISEADGSYTVRVVISNPNAMATTFQLDAAMSSTASAADYDLTLPTTQTFEIGNDSMIDISFNIIDDADIEADEVLSLTLSNANNGAVVISNTFNLTILDDDAPLNKSLVLVGAYDGPLSGGTPKGVELYVLEDIPDLSIYGVGTANNGGGSDGQEFTFPDGSSATQGDRIFIATDSTNFNAYFEVYPTYLSGSINPNGDDAIELFENNQVIDVFGDINVNGDDEPWDYTNSWAYRKDGTGPDDDVFVLDNWYFGGVNGLDGTINSGATAPYPLGTYSPIAPTAIEANNDSEATEVNVAINIDVFANDVLPNGVTTLTIIDPTTNGIATANGIVDVTYTPNMDVCGGESFRYEVCDGTSCDTATIVVVINCPSEYPLLDIGIVTADSDGNLAPDSLTVTCELIGVVHGVNMNGGGVQFTIIDGSNEGIGVYNQTDNLGYTVTEGDEVSVLGTIDQFRGLTQIIADEINVLGTNNALATPTVVTALDETTESQLVRINSLLVDDSWTPGDSGFNVDVTDGTNTYTMRIDNDVSIYSWPDAPGYAFDLIGIGGQFTTDVPADNGYQLLPRYDEDIMAISSVNDPALKAATSFYPNPAYDRLTVEAEINLDAIVITNTLGQEVLTVLNPNTVEHLDVKEMQTGVYMISFTSGKDSWSTLFVKQ